MLLTALLLASLLDTSAAVAQREDPNVAAIGALLDAQVAGWNRGDIDAYMDGYAREATTTFIAGDTLTRGWKTVLDRYKRNYDTREKMGTLALTELDIRPLADLYIVTGRWQLTRQADTPRGRFTLLLRRTPAGWRIFHDHTSSAP